LGEEKIEGEEREGEERRGDGLSKREVWEENRRDG